MPSIGPNIEYRLYAPANLRPVCHDRCEKASIENRKRPEIAQKPMTKTTMSALVHWIRLAALQGGVVRKPEHAGLFADEEKPTENRSPPSKPLEPNWCLAKSTAE